MTKLISLDYQRHPKMGSPEHPYTKKDLERIRQNLEDATREQFKKLREGDLETLGWARTYVLD